VLPQFARPQAGHFFCALRQREFHRPVTVRGQTLPAMALRHWRISRRPLRISSQSGGRPGAKAALWRPMQRAATNPPKT
jgi:hypothetical protein